MNLFEGMFFWFCLWQTCRPRGLNRLLGFYLVPDLSERTSTNSCRAAAAKAASWRLLAMTWTGRLENMRGQYHTLR